MRSVIASQFGFTLKEAGKRCVFVLKMESVLFTATFLIKNISIACRRREFVAKREAGGCILF